MVVVEIVVVGSITFLTFLFFGLNYAALLGVLVGISVIIPFIGGAIVTLPVFVIAVLQFGWSLDLGWVMLAYAVIQFLDGNVLVPLLLSEAVDLHPITIIVAVLAFAMPQPCLTGWRRPRAGFCTGPGAGSGPSS